MGVTYKLKSEIVDFILSQKRVNPTISCRKLVAVIDQTFHINVSKSSVNAVIKEAQLSNPIGRIPADPSKSQRFKIPREKKIQLFGEPQLEPESEVLVQPPVPGTEAIIIKEASEKPKRKAPVQKQVVDIALLDEIAKEIGILKSALTEIENKAAQVSADDDRAMRLLPDPVAVEDPLNASSIAAQAKATEVTNVEQHFEIKNMAALLFRAVLGDWTRKPVLQEFLQKHTDFQEHEIRILEILMCLPSGALEDPMIGLNPEHAWIWAAYDFESAPSEEILKNLLNKLQQIKVPCLDMFSEMEYFFSTINHAAIILHDGSKILLDGRCFNNSSTAEQFLPSSLMRSVDSATELINGTSPVFFRCNFTERILEELRNLIDCCHAKEPRQMSKIVIYEEGAKQFLEFASPGVKSRNFIFVANLNKSQLEAVRQKPNISNEEVDILIEEEIVLDSAEQDGREVLKFRMVGFLKNNKAYVVLTDLWKDSVSTEQLQTILKTSELQVEEIITLKTIFTSFEEHWFQQYSSEIDLINAFKFIKNNIFTYMCFLCLLNKDNINEFANICHQRCSVTIISGEIRAEIKVENSEILPKLVKFVNNINCLNPGIYNKKVHLIVC